MTKKGKKRGRGKYTNLKLLRTKRAFLVIIFEKFYLDCKNKNRGQEL